MGIVDFKALYQKPPSRVMPGTCPKCVWGEGEHAFGCQHYDPDRCSSCGIPATEVVLWVGPDGNLMCNVCLQEWEKTTYEEPDE
jgi:hypothetical protein